MLGERFLAPRIGGGRARDQADQRSIEIADRLMHQLDRGRHIGGLDINLQKRRIADPGFVFDLDRIVAQSHDQIGGTQETPLNLPAAALDAADRKRVILVDHALGHGGRCKRQVVALDEFSQQLSIAHTHRGRAEHRDRPLRGGDQRGGAGDGGIRRRGEPLRRGQSRHRLVGRRQRHVLGKIEMHRTFRLAAGEPDRFDQSLRDAPLAERQRRLGDGPEQSMVVDPHLDASPELIGVEIAGDRDHGRAIEKGAADPGRQIGGAGAERRDAQARRSGHPARHVGGEAGGALVGGQHEFDAARAHRLHQRQHVAARNAEAAVDAGRLQGRDDQIGIVHELRYSPPMILARASTSAGVA